jgi:AcrR family transcriptional regulator
MSHRKSLVTEEQWLAAALEMFAQGGEPAIKIEQLARVLGVTKAGFYWHFKNRADLLKYLLDFWTHQYTEVVTENTLLEELPPSERLLVAMEMIHDNHLGALDMHFHIWAMKDKEVATRVRSATAKRLKFIKSIFSDAGFSGEESEMRARLFVIHEANELTIFKTTKKSQTAKFRQRRCRMLLSPE